MKRSILIVVAVAVFVLSLSLVAFSQEAGEGLFGKHCSACHPNGGNVFKANKTLSKADMEANNVKTTADIVNLIRNPGPLMTKIDQETLPDKDAMQIAEFVLQKFNK
ncbi:MAG: c-type cytochrome [Dissulfurispiraceae bacterium]|jgi:cytochrome c6|nr:c-type cytochrome [Dissulfurispiraceae bacterium]